MGRRWVVLAVLCAVFLAAPAALAGNATTVTPGERRVVDEINRVRAAHGVPALRLDDRLQRAAKAHSRDMMARGYIGHGEFGRRLSSYGVRNKLIGENVAWASGGRVRAGGIVAHWMTSGGHRANLLSRRFHRLGIGTAHGAFGGHRRAHVVTADFSA